MHPPHAISQANKLVKSLEDAGYSDMQDVKDFCEELHQMQTPQHGAKQQVEKEL